MTDSAELLNSIAERMLEDIKLRIEQGGVELKDYKTITGALKELRELQRSGDENGGKEGITVRFLGEANELSL